MRALFFACLLAPLGCTAGEDSSRTGALTVWAHAGQASERAVLEAQVARFNAAHKDSPIAVTFLPEGAYNAQVQAAAMAGELPDILEFDGPYLARYVWQRLLVPIDDHLPADLREDLLPSVRAQGRIGERLYAVGAFDSGLALYGRRSLLEQVGARLPAHPDEAWRAEELDKILQDLAARDPDGAALDLKLNYQGEWLPYAYAPLIRSAGGDLVSRGGRPRAAGHLDSPAAVAAMSRVQGWIRNGRVDPNVDDGAFVRGRVALSLSGHWDAARYREAHGDDVVLLPMPDFGEGSRTAQGSWAWAITRRCARPKAAARFLRFLLRDEEVLAICRANSAVPATRAAIAASEDFAEGGWRSLFVTQLSGPYAVPRPRTAAYPLISSVFQEAFRSIRDGGDVAAVLSEAARRIDEDIADNKGYRIR